MHDYQDDTDRTKFSSLEVEKFRRVVDYMENTVYDKEKLLKGRKNFYNFFTQYDSRRNIKLTEVFPELENFYMSCATQE